MNFGFYEGSFTLFDSEMDDHIQYSFMAMLGGILAPLFAPLGFGDWQSVATSVTGLVAKENVVATVGIITSLGDAGEADPGMWEAFGAMMGGSAPAIMAFCAFYLLCAPCFAAIGAIRRQMASAKWTWFAIGCMTVFAYAVALMIYQFGMFFSTGSFTIATAFAVIVLAGMLFQIFRPMPRFEDKRQKTLASFPPMERSSESRERVYRFGPSRRYRVRVPFHSFLSQERHVWMQGTLCRLVRVGFVFRMLFRFAFGVFSRIVPRTIHGRSHEARCGGRLEDFVVAFRRILSVRQRFEFRSAKLCDAYSVCAADPSFAARLPSIGRRAFCAM